MFLSNLKAKLELGSILKELQNYLANNYKDAAHEQRRLLGEKCEAYYAAGKLSPRTYRKYKQLYLTYTQQMKDYHH